MDQYMKRLQQVIASAIEGMSSDQLAWRPEGKWSTVEILEHLYLSYKGTLKGCQKCLATGTPISAPTGLRHRILTLVVVGAGYMPEGRQAPQLTLPKGTPAQTVLTEIGPLIAATYQAIAQCEEHFGKHNKFLCHPILGPLAAMQWRKFHWIHGQHHVRQILQRRTLAPH